VIPEFEDDTGNVPPGVHTASWDELIGRFGKTPWRLELLEGLKRALDSLERAGCVMAYIDGSFVTSKEVPGDFDGCWEAAGVDPDELDPVLLEFDNLRAAQKVKFRGELFPAELEADAHGTSFLDFFQKDRDGNPKGILAIGLGGRS
jgi:hypothetical protein